MSGKTPPRTERRPRITRLEAHEVFVFGTNADGFHGTGAAGTAWRGTPGSARANDPAHWKHDQAFCRALKTPSGHPLRTGRWAVLGVAQGPMRGHEGKSYGLQTIVSPGMKRSFPLYGAAPWKPADGFLSVLGDYHSQVERLCVFARSRPALDFLVTLPAPQRRGLSGYTGNELIAVFQGCDCPENLILVLPA